MKNKKIFIIFILFLIFISFYFFFIFFKKSSSSSKNPQEQKIPKNYESTITPTNLPQKIIKCQNVVVTPETTVELFTYQSGNKVRYDYRVSARTDEESFTSQILFNDQSLYFWNPSKRYTGNEVNPPGIKTNKTTLKSDIKIDNLDEIIRFGTSGFSGDRLCKEWDDIDPVFEVPLDVTFNESPDTLNRVQENVIKICKVCENSNDESLKTICKKNLGCN